jgi:hypothetical protein
MTRFTVVELSELDPNIVFPSLIAAYAAIKSAQAARNSKPTGNGFADHVVKSLERIESRLDKHLDNHNN